MWDIKPILGILHCCKAFAERLLSTHWGIFWRRLGCSNELVHGWQNEWGTASNNHLNQNDHHPVSPGKLMWSIMTWKRWTAVRHLAYIRVIELYGITSPQSALNHNKKARHIALLCALQVSSCLLDGTSSRQLSPTFPYQYTSLSHTLLYVPVTQYFSQIIR